MTRFARNLLGYFVGVSFYTVAGWVYRVRWQFGNRVIGHSVDSFSGVMVSVNSDPIPFEYWIATIIVITFFIVVNHRVSVKNENVVSVIALFFGGCIMAAVCLCTFWALNATYSALLFQ